MNFESITEFIGLLGFIFLMINWMRSDLNKRLDDQSKRLEDQNRVIDKRFEDLKELFKSELTAKITPIEIALNNHITDTHKEIKALNDKFNKLEEGQKEILHELKRISK